MPEFYGEAIIFRESRICMPDFFWKAIIALTIIIMYVWKRRHTTGKAIIQHRNAGLYAGVSFLQANNLIIGS